MANAERNRSKMLGAEQQRTSQEIIRLTKTAFYEFILLTGCSILIVPINL